METTPRHRLFEAARTRAGMSLEELWLDCLTLGGEAGQLEVEAYLYGLVPLGRSQEDVLAHALNERLDDIHRANRLPYWARAQTPPPAEDPLQVLHELLTAQHDGGDPDAGTTRP